MNLKKPQKKTLKNNSREAKGGSFYQIEKSELQSVVFDYRIQGQTYREIQENVKKEHSLDISFQSIYNFFRDHKEEYEAYRQAWFEGMKEESIANARFRIRGLYAMAQKIQKKIEEIFDLGLEIWAGKNYEMRIAGLLREYRKYIDQIGIESGDRVLPQVPPYFAGQSQVNIFGDQIVNQLADQAIEVRAKESADKGNRIKANRLSDFGNSISAN